MVFTLPFEIRKVVGYGAALPRNPDALLRLQFRLASPDFRRSAVRNIVVPRAQKDVMGKYSGDASDRSSEEQLRPEEQVAHDAVVRLRAEFPQVAYTRHAGAPTDFPLSAVVLCKELQAGFQRRSDQSGYLNIVVMYRTARVNESRFRVPVPGSEHFGRELRLQIIVIGEAEKKLSRRLLDEKLAMPGRRHGGRMPECAEAAAREAFDDLGGLVVRTIVGDEDLYIRGSLSKRALDGAAEKVRAVDRGDSDTQTRHQETATTRGFTILLRRGSGSQILPRRQSQHPSISGTVFGLWRRSGATIRCRPYRGPGLPKANPDTSLLSGGVWACAIEPASAVTCGFSGLFSKVLLVQSEGVGLEFHIWAPRSKCFRMGPQSSVAEETIGASDHPPRIQTLDGLRAIAILLVICAHYVPRVIRPGGAATRAILLEGPGWAGCGVDLFFVLSGFLITGILVDAKGSKNYFRRFYWRRSLRIFPAFYALLLFAIVRMRYLFRSLGFIWFALYLRNWFGADYVSDGRLGHLWSLAVEEQFYIAWSVVVFLCPSRYLLRVILMLIAVAPLVRALMHHLGYPGYLVFRVTPARMDSLLFGALVAVAIRSGWVPHGKRLALLGLQAGLAGLLILRLFLGPLSADVAGYQFAFPSLIALSFASLVFLSLHLREKTPAHRLLTCFPLSLSPNTVMRSIYGILLPPVSSMSYCRLYSRASG